MIFLAPKQADDAVAIASCAFSCFAIAAVIEWGVVVEKEGIGLVWLQTADQGAENC